MGLYFKCEILYAFQNKHVPSAKTKKKEMQTVKY